MTRQLLALLIVAASLYNYMLLWWLGLTIFSHGRRERKITWVATGGFLLGALFFAIHSGIIWQHTPLDYALIDPFWRLIWTPLVIWPLLWLAVAIWYSGSWQQRSVRIRAGFLMTAGGLLVGWTLLATHFPAYASIIATRQPDHQATLNTLLAIAIIYPGFGLICQGTGVALLRRTAPAAREPARQAAYPWMTGASVLLWLVVLAVGFVALWFALAFRVTPDVLAVEQTQTVLLLFDGTISLLIACAATLAGEALISYELLTDAVHPRRQMIGRWRRTPGWLALIACSAALASGALTDAAMALIITIGAAVTALALSSDVTPRIDEEDEYALPSPVSIADERGAQGVLTQSLAMLGQHVLHVDAVALLPPDNLSTLTGPLLYRCTIDLLPSARQIADWTRGQPDREPIALQSPDWTWLIPLHTLNGNGILLVKRHGIAMFTGEDLQAARRGGERILADHLLLAMYRRLLTMQRAEMLTDQLADHRVRRELHDAILPAIHSVLLTMSLERDARDDTIISELSGIHRAIANLLTTLPTHPLPAIQSDLFTALRHAIGQDFPATFASLTWEIDPAAGEVLQRQSTTTLDLVYGAIRELVRNAARYANGGDADRPVNLTITCQREEGFIRISVADDGVGTASAPPSQGSGQGLLLHRTLLAIIGAELDLRERSTGGTEGIIRVGEQI